jgi:predicted ribosome-associated RNA-binding protein Tma20
MIAHPGAIMHLLDGANVMAPGLVKSESLSELNIQIGDFVVHLLDFL